MDFLSSTPKDARLKQLLSWLGSLPKSYGLDLASMRPASSDASFRRYFRLDAAIGSVVVMDAPPKQEDCATFIDITNRLQKTGLHVAGILAQDVYQGFLLLDDLGHDTYYHVVQRGVSDEQLQLLYHDALNALVTMQTTPTQGLARFDKDRLLEELSLFNDWYVARHCGVRLNTNDHTALERSFSTLVDQNAQEAYVFVHRDFHSPNLIVSADAQKNPGLIDYQDAIAGPISYDIASLVMDARTTWEEPQQLDWAIRYWEKARNAGLPVNSDFADFHHAYEWMSLQRNLRILGVFARLSYRDGKHHYLDHIPRVNGYIRQVASRYSAFGPLLRVLDKIHKVPVTAAYTF